MHIVHVVRQYRPGIGGIESFVESLGREQVRAGHCVTVVTLDRIFTQHGQALPVSEESDGVQVHRVAWRGSRRYPIAPGFFRHLRDADLVHVHAVDFFCDAAAWTRFLHRKPLVLSTHGGFFHTTYAHAIKRAFFQCVTRFSLKAYRAVLASSHADAAVFRRIRSTSLPVVENGVDVEKFAGAGSPTLRKHLVFIGRFASNKRIDRLLDLLAALRAIDPDWRLSVVGVPWDLTAEGIRETAAARGLEGALDLQVGLDQAAIRQTLGRASFVVSASEYEGFGISVVECMAAGLWPILSDIPAFRRLHEASGLGLLGDFTDPAQLAHAILSQIPRLADDGQWRDECMTFARRFDWTIVAARIEAIYRQVLGEDSRVVLGVPVTATDRVQAIQRMDAATGEAPVVVAFLNAHVANLAARHSSFRDCLRGCLVLNDGVGVDLASRLLYGQRFAENLNGTDFTPAFLSSTRRHHRIFLLGARPDVVKRAARGLQAAFPQHLIVGTQHGYFQAAENDAIAGRIRASRADLVLVAMGNPRQELWIRQHLPATGAALAMCVGAYLDFMAGAMPRAPRWLRAIRAEWLFRLALEPRRLWRRYVLGNPLFLLRVLKQRWNGAYLADVATTTEPQCNRQRHEETRRSSSGGDHAHAA